MDGQQGRIRVRVDGGTATARIDGRGTMPLSAPFRAWAERALDGGASAVHVDLSRCDYLDSTFLGILLAVRRGTEQRGGRAFGICSPSPDVERLLRQMGLSNVLRVVDADRPDDDPGWADLPTAAAPDDTSRNVLDAHEELANVPGQTGRMFRRLAARLGQEWKKAGE